MNGIGDFVGSEQGKWKCDRGNVITIGLDTQTVFYQPSPFYTGQNIQVISHPQLNRHNALFLIVTIKKMVDKFSWGSYGATLTRLRKSHLYLPATESDEIDFAFMTRFMQEVEQDILGTTLKYLRKRQVVNKCKVGVIWKNFVLGELFYPLEPGRSKGLNHMQRNPIGTSYLGATNLNNGVLDFVQASPSLIQQGNCIAFIRNGEGSMGYSVYKAEPFVATSDISIGRHPRLNRYTGTFITTVADRVRGKYNFGYKRSATRLAKEILTLPSLDDGTPDWDYMEQYMQSLENEKILQYIESLTERVG